MKSITGGYQYRVNLAAAYMTRGITNSRTLDNCFEVFDGDIVVTALTRRAMKNRKLWDAIAKQWREGFPQSWMETATKYADVPTRKLPELAATMRSDAEKKWQLQQVGEK